MSAATGRWLLLAAGVATVAAVATAVYLDPPSEVRARRLDEQRVRDLAAIETSITEFKARQARLPASLDELASAGLRPPGKDPETASAYRYAPSGADDYRLCASFNRPSQAPHRGRWPANDVRWSHRAGEQCFERTAGKKSP